MIAADTTVRTLIDDLLEEQQRLTAVERFSRRHDRHALPAMETHYRALLPAAPPGEGEQYAFEVDLDACSGCKGCVTACHNLNGLDDAEGETWRQVGLLHGEEGGNPFLQTVTTACHHCVDPACLNGCPVLAYDKDPRTGIVRHLDDQCIGCQYCILKCPYDVPKYSPSRGIVRKCDMCANRLAVGEAPACVQACPNEAIKIAVVKKADAVAAAKAGVFLPGAPDPGYTVPTTRYLSKKGLPANMEAADAHVLKPEHSHPPLVVMLVLTQLSAGAFCVSALLRFLFPENLMTRLSPFQSGVALAVGLLAIGASTLHLGRPLGAWRAVVGLKTSWLSREIVAFGLFAGLAVGDAASFWLPFLRYGQSCVTGVGASLGGLLGVFCSFMIYQDTRRPFWSAFRTGVRFFGTTVVLGVAAVLFLSTLQAWLEPAVAAHGAYAALTRRLAGVLAVAASAKLAVEAAIFLHRRDPQASPLGRTARLLMGELAEIAAARFLFGTTGGLVLPLAFLAWRPEPGTATLGYTFFLLLFAVLGELAERYLFFTAVVAPKMPGTLR